MHISRNFYLSCCLGRCLQEVTQTDPRTSALNLTEGFLDVGVGRVTVQVYREVVHPRQMQEHRYQSPFRSLKRRHWHGANVLHWEMDILTLVITHLTKWPQNGYTDACDYTSYKVAANNINLDKSSQSFFVLTRWVVFYRCVYVEG